jgi:hypothetical protein
MSKRRADAQLTDRDNGDRDDEIVAPDVSTWQERGTASADQMANRRVVETAEKKEEQPNATTTTSTTSTTSTTPTSSSSTTSTSPFQAPKSPFTFNFGSADSTVKWPTFEPTALPTFKPATGLPPFNMNAVSSGKFEINWPTFSPANFNFEPKKFLQETNSTSVTTPTSTTSTTSQGNLDNLEHTDLTSNADKTNQLIEATKNTPRKTFGQNVEQPNSPVVQSSPTRIAEAKSSAVIEKQENLVTGEENEDTLYKARAKLFEYEDGNWGNKGVGFVKLMKNKDNNKTRIVMRLEGSGQVVLNVPLFSKMEVKYHQQKNVSFTGMNAKDGNLKSGSFSLQFNAQSEKEGMFTSLTEAVKKVPAETISKTESTTETKTETKEEK